MKTKLFKKTFVRCPQNAKMLILFFLLNLIVPFVTAQSTEKVTIEGKEYYIHTVKAGESLYSIGKLYSVPESVIAQANRNSFLVLQVGERLKIPVNNSQPEDNDYFIHIVQPNQTLAYLCAKFSVSAADIYSLNPQAKNGIKVGDYLKIPEKPLDIHVPGDYNSIISYTGTPCDEFVYKPREMSFNVAIMLPFHINKNHSVYWSNVTEADALEMFGGAERFLEFYEGCLMAVDSIRKEGVSINLYVYDTQNDDNVVKAILQKQEMKNMDLIIGPVYPENVKLVAAFAKQNQINMVSPLTQTDDILSTNPFLFQVNSSIDTRIFAISNYLKKFENSNIIVVHNGSQSDLDDLNSFEYHLGNANLTFSAINFKTQSGVTGLKRLLNTAKRNILLIPSTDEIFVTEVVNKVFAISSQYDITTFASYNWTRYSNLELEYYQALDIHLHSTTFVDYEHWRAKEFIEKYRLIFKAEPSNYSFQGYDVALYFLSALKHYGPNFQFCMLASPRFRVSEGVQCKFKFQQYNNTGGYENYGVSILKYTPDYNLIELDLNATVPYNE